MTKNVSTFDKNYIDNNNILMSDYYKSVMRIAVTNLLALPNVTKLNNG